MQFTREFFRPEIRDGFYVNGTMKRMWASSLQVTVDVFAEVCRKNDIQWYMDWGTLLGAVRHKGYIPWDDDIDVMMLRDEYVKFQNIMNDAFPEGYTCMSYQNPEMQHWDILTRVLNFRDMCLNPEFLKKNCDCPYPTGLDVFPVDFIPDDPEEEEQYRNLVNMIGLAIELKEELNNPYNDAAKEVRDAIENVIGYHFNSTESIELQTFRLSEAIFGMYGREDRCSRAVHALRWAQGKEGAFMAEWFERTIELPFEGVMLPSVSDPDGVLQVEYGDDYMTPLRDFPSHDYPFYKDMERILINDIGSDPIYYNIDAVGMEVLERQKKNTDKISAGG